MAKTYQTDDGRTFSFSKESESNQVVDDHPAIVQWWTCRADGADRPAVFDAAVKALAPEWGKWFVSVEVRATPDAGTFDIIAAVGDAHERAGSKV